MAKFRPGDIIFWSIDRTAGEAMVINYDAKDADILIVAVGGGIFRDGCRKLLSDVPERATFRRECAQALHEAASGQAEIDPAACSSLGGSKHVAGLDGCIALYVAAVARPPSRSRRGSNFSPYAINCR